MSFENYREKMKHIRGLIDRCREVYGKNIWMCGNWYNHKEDRWDLLNKFSKDLKAYARTLPDDLIKKIDLKEFDGYNYHWTFGNEDEGWEFWGPQDEIITTFAYYYHENNNFESSYKKTLDFYKETKLEEWSEGRYLFLERLLYS